MLDVNVMRVVGKIERDFLPDEYRIVARLSEEKIFHHKWPGQRIWRRGDGASWRDMHSLEVIYGDSEHFDEKAVLIDALWVALVNNFEGDMVEFSGPFPNDGWRPAFKHLSAIYVKFEHVVAFGSLGILKNPVWNIRGINGEECKGVEQAVS